jgi:hypothetical protein
MKSKLLTQGNVPRVQGKINRTLESTLGSRP